MPTALTVSGYGSYSVPVQLSPFAETIFRQKYSMNGTETWAEASTRVAQNVMAALGYAPNDAAVRRIEEFIATRKFIPGGRYLYAAGRPLHQVCNCLLLRAEDTREGWGDLWRKAGMALLTGAGIGIEYSNIRPSGSKISRTGGQASGPCSLMHTVNEIGRQVMQGGSRRSAIWAGLVWSHDDVDKFLRVKDWAEDVRALRKQDPRFPAPMELTNVSIRLDDHFFDAYTDPDHPDNGRAHEVYDTAVRRMCKTGEPGFSVDLGKNAGEHLRNACTEVTSADTDDVCNLGSINLARIETVDELRNVIDAAVLFLIAGSEYTSLPYNEVGAVRDSNRRLGLGVMGVHEWLLARGKAYGPDAELASWLAEYSMSTNIAAGWADKHSLSRPVKTRAIAPTGTIGIIGETTTGIEPVYCVAYKRRYLVGSVWAEDRIVDPTAARLIREHAIDPSEIEDAYTLSLEPGRRIEMQAWTQQYVDHGISSTVNLPHPLDADDADAFGAVLMQYLPELRGITAYPSGARGLDPLERMEYAEAAALGAAERESEERCVGGACGV